MVYDIEIIILYEKKTLFIKLLNNSSSPNPFKPKFNENLNYFLSVYRFNFREKWKIETFRTF